MKQLKIYNLIALALVGSISPALAQTATQPYTNTLVDWNAPMYKGSELSPAAAPNQQAPSFWGDDPVSNAFHNAATSVQSIGKQDIQTLLPPPKLLSQKLRPDVQKGQMALADSAQNVAVDPNSQVRRRLQMQRLCNPASLAGSDFYRWSAR